MVGTGRPRGIKRRDFLRGAASAAGASALGFPAILSAQPREVKIGSIQPLTGVIAAIGKSARQGNALAVEHVNARGGIASMGGAKLKLLQGDSELKPEVGRAEAERLIREGAQILVGAFDSGVTLAIAQVAEQSRMPFLIDIAAADQITQRGYKYVFRNFITTSVMGRNGVQYLLEIFRMSGVAPKRAVLLHVSDLFGQVQSSRFLEFHKKLNAPFEVVETIAYPVTTQDLSTEVAKARAARPDLLLAVTRLNDAILLVQEMYKQRVEVQALVGPGNPGFYHPQFTKQLGKLAEYTLDNVPWVNPKSALTQKVGQDYEKQFNEPLTTDSAYAYEGVLVVADILERAGSTDPEKFVQAAKATDITEHVTIGGPIRYSDNGDNLGASTAMIQIHGGRARVVLPTDVAEAKLLYPVPKLWER